MSNMFVDITKVFIS